MLGRRSGWSPWPRAAARRAALKSGQHKVLDFGFQIRLGLDYRIALAGLGPADHRPPGRDASDPEALDVELADAHMGNAAVGVEPYDLQQFNIMNMHCIVLLDDALELSESHAVFWR